MSIKLKQIILTTLLSTTFIFTFSNTGSTGPLENLERERAMVIKNIIDPDLSPGERQEKIKNSKIRLVDLERMVLRDTKLKGSVRHIQNLGEHLLCYINIGGDNEITAKLDVSSPARLNQEISLSWISENTHYFNSTGISVN